MRHSPDEIRFRADCYADADLVHEMPSPPPPDEILFCADCCEGLVPCIFAESV